MQLSRNNKQKLALFRCAFRGRSDCHGTRDIRNARACSVKSPPTDRVLRDHLLGRRPVGIYPLVVDKTWFAAIDLDEPDPGPVLALNQLACGLDLPPLVERSKSKGWHLWWFAEDEGLPAWMIRRLLRWMTTEVGRPETEVFPKQDRLERDRFGNFIFLPLDGRLVSKARTIFVEPTRWLPPVKDPWDTLATRVRVSESRLAGVMSSIGLGAAQPDEPEVIHTIAAGDIDSPVSEGTSRVTNTSGRFDPAQNLIHGSKIHARAALPLCARRMLAQGVSSYQRVACFRLAVHLHRLGFPRDLAQVMLRTWARKNKPSDGKRVITHEEIDEQTDCAYTGRYRGYGCDDPRIARFCTDDCPLQRNSGRNDRCNTRMTINAR